MSIGKIVTDKKKAGLYKKLIESYAHAWAALQVPRYPSFELAVNSYLDACAYALDIPDEINGSYYFSGEFSLVRSNFMNGVLKECVREGKLHDEVIDRVLLGYLENHSPRKVHTDVEKEINDMKSCEKDEVQFFLDELIIRAGEKTRSLFTRHKGRLQRLTGFANFKQYIQSRSLERYIEESK